MNLAFRADEATPVYQPIMPITTDDTLHHLQSIPPHHHEMMLMGCGGIGVGVIVDGLNMNTAEPMKRKRGRPRKYSPPHGNVSLNLTSPLSHHHQHHEPHQSPLLQHSGFQSPPSPSSTAKKARGRPPGSGRKNQLATLGSGVGFAHVITVKAGEDVLLKIMSFSQNGPRGVCILSANGALSNVTLHQAATLGGAVSYEGRFEILSLSGSFLPSENSGQRSRTGCLSVLLAGPDGRVLGGVAGLLIAASSVQVIVGSFISEDWKESSLGINQPETLYALGALVAGSPTSRGTFSESSGGPVSPPNQSTGGCSSNPQGMPNVPWK
ncbi:AT-hook motif nuclear-localized protein 10 isoform X2 [Hevea brasiliensis]|nr:AT-hook motif nuclear-localized protein 10 isoform X2 [Hevea brasiliensis]